MKLVDLWAGSRRAQAQLAAATFLLALVAGCRADIDTGEGVRLQKLVPATVSDENAWALFDRATAPAFVPDGQPVHVHLDHASSIWAVKVFGSAPYRLSIQAPEGGTVGFSTIDLSKLGPGWHTFGTDALVSTKELVLGFEALGAAAPIPEIELWEESERPTTVADPREPGLADDFVVLPAGTSQDRIQAGNCATFEVSVPRSPTVFRRVQLAYVLGGALRSFSLSRTINGVAHQAAGRWLAGNAGEVSEELDPSGLLLGMNEVKLCVPSAATADVTIEKLRLIGELDRGTHLARVATLGEDARDASALVDADSSTSVRVAADELVTLKFDRLIAPDAILLPSGTLSNAECVDRDGSSRSLPMQPRAVGSEKAILIDGLARACSELRVRFAETVEISDVDVSGSGAAERVDWPRVVVTSPREHFGEFAWVRGFVTRPSRMPGAIRVQVSNQPAEGLSGEFGAMLTRTGDTNSAWPVAVRALLPDGTARVDQLVLQANSKSQLATPSAASLAGAASNTVIDRFGAEGDAVVVRAATAARTEIRLGSKIGVDVPAGALARPTNITVRHLGADVLPPLDPGMINVTAPQGRGFEFLPHGQKFARGVEVVVPYDPTLIPEGMTIDDVHTYFYDPIAKHWKRLDRVATDVGDQIVRSRTTHFTIMIDAVLATPKNPTPLGFDPTLLTSIPAASPTAGIDLIEPPTANSMGDARVALPIRIPAARGQHSPSLAIDYNSSAGNSWLGLHWDLQLPRIEIDTRWGVPRYDGNERYLLDGAALVPTTETEGPKCQDGKPGLRFHTRVEGGFGHILRCTYASSDGPIYHFEVRDHDGTLFVYGDDPVVDAANPSHASLADPGSPSHVARWHLAKVVDRHGNITRYSYATDDVAGGEPSREIYPARITYTERGTLAPPYRITFQLDDGSRPDQMSSGRTGFKVATRRLLRAVHVQYRNRDIRTYVLRYRPGTFSKSLLASIRVYGSRRLQSCRQCIPSAGLL